jgi:two-component system, OmpR family, phosphate regulon sensor histidine kinase PhoR
MRFKSPFHHSEERIEHQRLTSLVNSMTDAVLAVDEDTRVVLYNAAALGILDLNTITQGTPLSEAFKPQDSAGQAVNIAQMVSDTAVPVINRDLCLKYGDSSTVNLYLSIAPVHLGYGKSAQAGHVLVIRDITREKSLEEEREEFAQLIAQKGGDLVEIQKALAEAHDQTIYLSDMINDLATLSRAERGNLDIEINDIKIHELFNDLMGSYVPAAQAKSLLLTAEIAPDTPDLKSSQLYVKEILQNFITNAIKYTSQGRITVKAEPSQAGVKFSVTDTGIGISKSDQERFPDAPS